MKKKQLLYVVITLATAVLALVAAVGILHLNKDSTVARIYVNNKLYDKIDLGKVQESYTIDIPNSENKHNIILVENGAISMQSADCPDKLCVKQGKISTGAYPIVCLPHKIIISLEGEKGTDAVLR